MLHSQLTISRSNFEKWGGARLPPSQTPPTGEGDTTSPDHDKYANIRWSLAIRAFGAQLPNPIQPHSILHTPVPKRRVGASATWSNRCGKTCFSRSTHASVVSGVLVNGTIWRRSSWNFAASTAFTRWRCGQQRCRLSSGATCMVSTKRGLSLQWHRFRLLLSVCALQSACSYPKSKPCGFLADPTAVLRLSSVCTE